MPGIQTTFLAVAAAAALVATDCRAAPSSFDGSWAVTLTCPAHRDGTRGYTFRFPAQVKDGTLHGQNGTEGAVGWLVLDGQLQTDGSATLTAHGVTGSPDFAVGRPSQQTPYSYHVRARFSGSQGTGERAEVRACSFAFARQG